MTINLMTLLYNLSKNDAPRRAGLLPGAIILLSFCCVDRYGCCSLKNQRRKNGGFFSLLQYIVSVENVFIIATATLKSIKGRKLVLTNRKSVD